MRMSHVDVGGHGRSVWTVGRCVGRMHACNGWEMRSGYGRGAYACATLIGEQLPPSGAECVAVFVARVVSVRCRREGCALLFEMGSFVIPYAYRSVFVRIYEYSSMFVRDSLGYEGIYTATCIPTRGL